MQLRIAQQTFPDITSGHQGGRYEFLNRDHQGKYFIWKRNYTNMTLTRKA